MPGTGMTWMLIIGVVLEGVFILILLWVAKILWDAVRSLDAARTEERNFGSGLKCLSDWATRQSDRENAEHEQDQALLAHYQSRDESEVLPVPLLAEAVLLRKGFVASTLSGLIEEAHTGINEAIQSKDYRRCEAISARLHELIDRNLFRCPWPEMAKVYARAREVTTQADETAVGAIREELDADGAVRQEIPKRLIGLAFSPDVIRSAQEKLRSNNVRSQWQRTVAELAVAATKIDTADPVAAMELQRLELRSTQLLSSAPDSASIADLNGASQTLRDARDRYTFQSRLAEANVSVEEIRDAFDKLASVKTDLEPEIPDGHVFEQIDAVLARCGLYFSVTGDLKHPSYAEACHAIPQKDFIVMRLFVTDKQQRAYNSWALKLITKTKKKLKEGESMNPMHDYSPLVSDLFPKVFNRVDDALLNPSVSRLFYELHAKLIDLVKKENTLVRKLINEQIFSTKVGIYRLNDT